MHLENLIRLFKESGFRITERNGYHFYNHMSLNYSFPYYDNIIIDRETVNNFKYRYLLSIIKIDAKKKNTFQYILKTNEYGLDKFDRKTRKKIQTSISSCNFRRPELDDLIFHGLRINRQALNAQKRRDSLLTNKYKWTKHISALYSNKDVIILAVYTSNNIMIGYIVTYKYDNIYFNYLRHYDRKFEDSVPGYGLLYMLVNQIINEEGSVELCDGIDSYKYLPDVRRFKLKMLFERIPATRVFIINPFFLSYIRLFLFIYIKILNKKSIKNSFIRYAVIIYQGQRILSDVLKEQSSNVINSVKRNPDIYFRLANQRDADKLAEIHRVSGKKQGGGFLTNLGLSFLKLYYKIRLKDSDSIILVAEDEKKSICGFVSGTLAAEEYLKVLRNNRIRIIFSLLPVLFKFPSLFEHLKERYYFIVQKDDSEKFGITKGPRIDYWTWDKTCKSGNSIFLFKAWLDLMFKREIYSIRGEVDQENQNILDMVKCLGARIMKEVKLRDGRTRYFIEFVNKRLAEGFRIRNLSEADLDDVVSIHLKTFRGFFLTFLGSKFLYALYKYFLYDKNSICLIAESEGEVRGFAIGNNKPENLFRKMLKRRGIILFFLALKALLNDPKVVSKRLLFALSYRGEAPSGFKSPALLSSIGVVPSVKNQGIGSHLVMAFCWEAFIKGSDVVYLTTDKLKNDSVNSFYLKNGFHVLDELKHSDGRVMNRYIKLPDEKIV